MSETPIFIGSKHKADVSNPPFVTVDGVWIAATNNKQYDKSTYYKIDAFEKSIDEDGSKFYVCIHRGDQSYKEVVDKVDGIVGLAEFLENKYPELKGVSIEIWTKEEIYTSNGVVSIAPSSEI